MMSIVQIVFTKARVRAIKTARVSVVRLTSHQRLLAYVKPVLEATATFVVVPKINILFLKKKKD